MRPEYIIQRQGRSFVLYAGLLNEAHERGLLSIRTRLIQAPSKENDNTAICHASVEMAGEHGPRRFEGIGDANRGNVNPTIAPHVVRMAETRSKARALRDALNIDAVSIEELGGESDSPDSNGWTGPKTNAASPSGPTQQTRAASGHPSPPNGLSTGKLTPRQTAIAEMGRAVSALATARGTDSNQEGRRAMAALGITVANTADLSDAEMGQIADFCRTQVTVLSNQDESTERVF